MEGGGCREGASPQVMDDGDSLTFEFGPESPSRDALLSPNSFLLSSLQLDGEVDSFSQGVASFVDDDAASFDLGGDLVPSSLHRGLSRLLGSEDAGELESLAAAPPELKVRPATVSTPMPV